MIHDAAVAGLGDVVIELQLEPVVFVGGDDVAGVVRIDADERAVLHLPARADAFLLEIVPAVEVLAVEKELPSGGLLGVGERVDLGVILGEKTNAGGRGSKQLRSKVCVSYFWMLS